MKGNLFNGVDSIAEITLPLIYIWYMVCISKWSVGRSIITRIIINIIIINIINVNIQFPIKTLVCDATMTLHSFAPFHWANTRTKWQPSVRGSRRAAVPRRAQINNEVLLAAAIGYI